MDQLTALYRLLSRLKKAEDYEELDRELISAEGLGISGPMWRRVMMQAAKEGYVANVKAIEYDQSDLPMIKYTGTPFITFKGTEFLRENSTMRKIAQGMKGITEIIGDMK